MGLQGLARGSCSINLCERKRKAAGGDRDLDREGKAGNHKGSLGYFVQEVGCSGGKIKEGNDRENRALGTQFIWAGDVNLVQTAIRSFILNTVGFTSSLPTFKLPFNLTMVLFRDPGETENAHAV